jgi:hypothetical protein
MGVEPRTTDMREGHVNCETRLPLDHVAFCGFKLRKLIY